MLTSHHIKFSKSIPTNAKYHSALFDHFIIIIINLTANGLLPGGSGYNVCT